MLLDEIIEILSQEKASLTDALLKTKILLHQIGKKELVEWVNNAHNTLRADFGYINPGLRDQLAARLRHTCPV